MSEIADIVEDYRQHTRWVGPVDARVAREVPAPVIKAIEAYEHARQLRETWNEQFIIDRDEASLNLCSTYGRLMEWWWQRLGDLLPREPGWYPHAGRIYGYVGKKTGFELVRHAGAWRWPDPARAAAWALAWSRRRGEEERVKALCLSHNEARGHGSA